MLERLKDLMGHNHGLEIDPEEGNCRYEICGDSLFSRNVDNDKLKLIDVYKLSEIELDSIVEAIEAQIKFNKAMSGFREARALRDRIIIDLLNRKNMSENKKILDSNSELKADIIEELEHMRVYFESR